MGYVPLPPMPTSAAMFLAFDESRLRREMRGRTSRLWWRRRRAHAACLVLIRALEAVNEMAPDPWLVRAPKPVDLPRAWVTPQQPPPDIELQEVTPAESSP